MEKIKGKIKGKLAMLDAEQLYDSKTFQIEKIQEILDYSIISNDDYDYFINEIVTLEKEAEELFEQIEDEEDVQENDLEERRREYRKEQGF